MKIINTTQDIVKYLKYKEYLLIRLILDKKSFIYP